jgi:HK97 gp10 family phage protein
MSTDTRFAIQIEGAAEIIAKLQQIEKKMSQKILRSACREGAKVIESQVRANLKSMSSKSKGATQMRSRMIKALGIRAWKRQRSGGYGVMIRFLPEKDDLRRKRPIGVEAFTGYTMGSASSIKSKKLVQGSTYYIPTAIEYGHAFPGRGGKEGSPKDVPAKSFFRKAFDSEKNNAERTMREVILAGIEKATHGG